MTTGLSRAADLAEVAAVRAAVDRTLADFLAGRAGQSEEDSGLAAVLSLLGEFVQHGGKRIRPLFCVGGWYGAGGADTSADIVAVATALELFHAFALIHDDIMDRSAVRRGRPSLHEALAALHRRSGWTGDAAHAGVSLGVLAGDLCLAWSGELLDGCALPAARVRQAQSRMYRMHTEVVLGQYLDLLGQAAGGSLAGALRIVLLKAAKYTVVWPLQIGGVLAGAEPALLACYQAFGVPLGEAFQLRDDLLGMFGDPAVTGKSAIEDLREGKPTVLIAVTRDRASAAAASRIAELYGNPELDERGAAVLRDIVTDTGSRATVESMVAERAEHAAAELNRAPVAEPARAFLRELASAAVDRTA